MSGETSWDWTDLTGGWDIESTGSPCYIAVDANGHPHVVYTVAYAAPHDYHYAHFDGIRWRIHLLDRGPVQWGGSVAIVLDKRGWAHIAYTKVFDADRGWWSTA